MIYDISRPHDLRAIFGKPTMTHEEIDHYLDDEAADPDLKPLLLLDVQPQGYRRES